MNTDAVGALQVARFGAHITPYMFGARDTDLLEPGAVSFREWAS